MSHGKDVLDALRDETAALREKIPGVYEGFAQTHKAALGDGALSTKAKELIVEAMERAGDHLLFDGVTIAVMPQWTPSQERLRYVRGLLSVMPRGHLSVAF